MLRRFARGFRWGLFALGQALLVLWPASFVRAVSVNLPCNDGYAIIAANRGTCVLFRAQGFSVRKMPFDVNVFPPDREARAPLLPVWDRFTLPGTTGTSATFTQLFIPLWLIALLCLAWPMTSFILARRRRKGRGFEVEARPGAAVPRPKA